MVPELGRRIRGPAPRHTHQPVSSERVRLIALQPHGVPDAVHDPCAAERFVLDAASRCIPLPDPSGLVFPAPPQTQPLSTDDARCSVRRCGTAHGRFGCHPKEWDRVVEYIPEEARHEALAARATTSHGRRKLAGSMELFGALCSRRVGGIHSSKTSDLNVPILEPFGALPSTPKYLRGLGMSLNSAYVHLLPTE